MKLSQPVSTRIIAGIAIAVAVAVFGWCQRREGVKVGAANQEIKASAVVVTAAKADVAVARGDATVEVNKSVTKRADYHAARTKVEVKGDSVIADGQRLRLPSAAAALLKADTMSVQDSTAISKQARSDTLQTVLVGALDHHVDLLKEEKSPRCSRTCGVVIGTVGTVAVVVIAVKIIKAVAKR